MPANTLNVTENALLQAVEALLLSRLGDVRAQLHAINDRIARANIRMDQIEQLLAENFKTLSLELETFKDVQALKERMARLEGALPPKPSA